MHIHRAADTHGIVEGQDRAVGEHGMGTGIEGHRTGNRAAAAQGGAIGHGHRARARAAAGRIIHQQRAVADRRAAGVAVVAGERQGAQAGLGDGAGVDTIGDIDGHRQVTVGGAIGHVKRAAAVELERGVARGINNHIGAGIGQAREIAAEVDGVRGIDRRQVGDGAAAADDEAETIGDDQPAVIGGAGVKGPGAAQIRHGIGDDDGARDAAGNADVAIHVVQVADRESRAVADI